MDATAQASPTGSKERFVAPTRTRVLLIDDQRIIGEAVRRLLIDAPDIEFQWEGDAQAALQTVLQWKPTVILQDLVMPDIDGFELVQRFRVNADTQAIPVIVLSTKEDPQLKAHAFATGANDYLVKLPDKLELQARLRYHSAAYVSRLERDAAFQALRESEQKLAEANIQLQRLAEVDGLTGIGNRRRFDDVLQTEWQRALRAQRPLSLLLCDIDYFKRYNDRHGHLAGDQCLKQVAAVLKANLRRPADLAARYGGEEFALILPETEKDGALAVAEACRSQLEALSLWNQEDSDAASLVTLSIGIASIVPTPELSRSGLIDLADRALYRAKESGRNRVACLD